MLENVSKNATCGRDKERKKEKLSCLKLAIFPDHPCQGSPLKFCMQGTVWELVIYSISSFMKIARGASEF